MTQAFLVTILTPTCGVEGARDYSTLILALGGKSTTKAVDTLATYTVHNLTDYIKSPI